MDAGTTDPTTDVRSFSQGATRAISDQLREICKELRAYGRATFPPAVSFCELADRVSAVAARLDRLEARRGWTAADWRREWARCEHAHLEQFKGHCHYTLCSCDEAARARGAATPEGDDHLTQLLRASVEVRHG